MSDRDRMPPRRIEAEAGRNEETGRPASMAEASRQWQDDGFGIFLHFSPSTAFQGRYQGEELDRDLWGEWMMRRGPIPIAEYEAQVRAWSPDRFNADEWAELLAASGCRYMVFTSKHHDGMAMFKSEATPYNIVDHLDAPSVDIFSELTEAVRKRGVKPGFYYSHYIDWHAPGGWGGPDGKTLDEYADDVVLPHLGELTTRYGRQHIAWFDCGRPGPLAARCVDAVRRHQPHIMVCSRVGGGLGDFASEGDQEIPPARVEGPWETCMTMNHHWAWYPEDRDHKSAGDVIRMLASIRSRGGNLLLNIGPDVRGRLPLRDQAALTQVGAWLRTHGESIYGVRATPYGDLPWGVCTCRPGKLYLHVFVLPSTDTLFLPGLQSGTTRACFLTDGTQQPLRVRTVPGGIEIDLASVDGFAAFANEHDTVVVLEHEGELSVDPRPVLDQDLDNRFIPVLARKREGVSLRSLRRPACTDHGTMAAAVYDHYAHGFTGQDACLQWTFSVVHENTFFVNVEYANLTGKPVSVKLSLGGQVLTAELPVTITHEKDWRWFRTERIGHLQLVKGDDLPMTFALETPPTERDRIPVHLEQGPTGRGVTTEHDGFMVKSIVLKSLAPLPYDGRPGSHLRH